MRGVEVHECEGSGDACRGVEANVCQRGVEVHVCQKGVDCFLKRHRRGFCIVCMCNLCMCYVHLFSYPLLFDMDLWTSQIMCIMIKCLSVPPPTPILPPGYRCRWCTWRRERQEEEN